MSASVSGPSPRAAPTFQVGPPPLNCFSSRSDPLEFIRRVFRVGLTLLIRRTGGGGAAGRGRDIRHAACAWLLATVTIAAAAPAGAERFGLGTPATPAQIAGWDIDARPDGQGLPPGSGTAEQGEALFTERCAACHGEFGEGRGRFPALFGGQGSLAGVQPVKTVGSFWPYTTTLFDFLRRAKPFGDAQSLDNDEVYALTAYILYINDLVAADTVLDARSLAALRMPNRDGFVADDRPDTPGGEPCMRDCGGDVRVIGRARDRDLTPDSATRTP